MVKKSDQQIVIYQTKSGAIEFKGDFKRDTLWASLQQIADLFSTDKSGISRHIKNIYNSSELERRSTVAKIATVQKEGKREILRKIEYFNLDVVLSVGYRVNSKRATQFRIWATNVLKKHILEGYTINEKRLKEARDIKLKEMEKAVALLQRVINSKQLDTDESQGLLKVITDYAQSWLLLQKYDEGKLGLPKLTRQAAFKLDYRESKEAIARLASELRAKKEAGNLFSQERGQAFEGILGNLYQAFGGKDLYPSLEEKAAHLLYFTIKDHPFSDGNKRIGSFLFILFLARNNYLLNRKGERKINDNALVALALLIAESDPREKETMVALIANLLFAGVKER